VGAKTGIQNPILQAPLMSHQAYYSLLQFMPNNKREEGINCGVMLVIPQLGFLDIMTLDNSLRILSLFNEPEGANKLRSMVKCIKRTVLDHREKMIKDNSFHYLPVKDFKDFRFCNFRNHMIEAGTDPDHAICNLFDELVDVDEDSLLVNAVKELLDKVKEDLYLVENGSHKNVGNKVSFRRATELLNAADTIRDIIED